MTVLGGGAILLGLLASAAQRPTLAALEREAHADSNEPGAHHALGVELARLGRRDDARRAFQQSVSIDPKFAPSWGALLRLDPKFLRPVLQVHRVRNRLQLVVVPPSDSVRFISRRVFLLNPLLDVSDGRRYALPSGWEGALRRGMEAFRNGHWAEAERRFAGVIKQTTRRHRDDAPPYALWYHALAQVELGHLDQAIENVERLLNAALRDSTPFGWGEAFSHQYTLAYLRHQAGQLDEAARIYRHLLEDQLGLDLVHLRLAQVLEAQGRWDQAVAERRHAVNANPDDPSLVFDLGMTLHNAGYQREAEEELQRAIAANPRESRAYLVLGAALQAQGKREAARTQYARFLELAPRRFAQLAVEARRRLAELPSGP